MKNNYVERHYIALCYIICHVDVLCVGFKSFFMLLLCDECHWLLFLKIFCFLMFALFWGKTAKIFIELFCLIEKVSSIFLLQKKTDFCKIQNYVGRD